MISTLLKGIRQGNLGDLLFPLPPHPPLALDSLRRLYRLMALSSIFKKSNKKIWSQEESQYLCIVEGIRSKVGLWLLVFLCQELAPHT